MKYSSLILSVLALKGFRQETAAADCNEGDPEELCRLS